MVEHLFEHMLPRAAEEKSGGEQSLDGLLERFGFDPVQHEQIQADLGMPLRDTLRRYFDADDLERAMATYLAYNLERHDASVRQMAGVAHLVRRLREAGLRLGVVTSKLRDTARRGLTLCHLDRPFEVVVAKEDTARHKPEPEPLIYALAALDAEAQECAYVGDTPLDVEAALRSDARAVGVATGRSPEADLVAAGAHAVLPNLADTSAVVAAVLSRASNASRVVSPPIRR